MSKTLKISILSMVLLPTAQLLLGCNGGSKTEAAPSGAPAASSPAPASTDEPDAMAKSNWVNNLTMADFKAGIVRSTVTVGASGKDGKFEYAEWSLHSPGTTGYAKFRTIIGDFASHAEVKAEYKEASAADYKRGPCSKFEVGVKRLMVTTLIEEQPSSNGVIVPCNKPPGASSNAFSLLDEFARSKGRPY